MALSVVTCFTPLLFMVQWFSQRKIEVTTTQTARTNNSLILQDLFPFFFPSAAKFDAHIKSFVALVTLLITLSITFSYQRLLVCRKTTSRVVSSRPRISKRTIKQRETEQQLIFTYPGKSLQKVDRSRLQHLFGVSTSGHLTLHIPLLAILRV